MNARTAHLIRSFVCVLLAVVLVLAGLLTLPARPAVAQSPTATVTASVLNVRSGPSPGYAVITTVTKGTVLTLLARDSAGSWVKVQLPNGTVGWVTTFYLSSSTPFSTLPVEAQAEAWAFVARPANLREGPGLGFPVILTLAVNEPIGLIARNADASWVQVRVRNNVIGWVASSLLIPSTNFLSLPLAAGLPFAPGVFGAPLSPERAGVGTINTGTASTHAGADKTYGIVAWVSQNEQVKLLGRNANGSWLYILFHEKALGWIEAVWVSTAVSIPTLPLVDHTKAPVGMDALQWLPGFIGGGGAPGGMAGTAMVSTGVASIRTGPNSSYPLITTAQYGTPLTLLGRNENASWVYVSTPTGVQGWISSALISTSVRLSSLPLAPFTPIDTFGTATVTLFVLNVRNAPNLSATVLTTVRRDMRLPLLGRDASGVWFKVRLPDGTVGWVGSGGVTIDVPLSALPVLTQ